MNTLANILANVGEFATPELGIQSGGALILWFVLMEVKAIRNDLADIKARLGILERNNHEPERN